MKEFAISAVVAVCSVVLLAATTGDGFCFGERPPLGDSTTCSNSTGNGFARFRCGLQCLSCYIGTVSSPFGCLTESNSCQCLQSESSGNRTSLEKQLPEISTQSPNPDVPTSPSSVTGDPPPNDIHPLNTA